MILQKNHNCWDIRQASRFSLLVDAQAYFAAFHDSLFKAQRSALLVGWDFHSGTALLRNEKGPDPDSILRRVLDRAARVAPDLHIHVLSWDYAMLYALEREPLAVFNFAWRSGPRLHFFMDGEHPLGASHHQKIVVLDDSTAFIGGLDLTQHRWDTPQHLPEDPRRQAPSGELYPPFHDVQGVVDGEAAKAVGELARRRWRHATGENLPAVSAGADTWPDFVTPDLYDVPVAIARTEPHFKGRPEVREIERLYEDAISASRECIYLESQYLTSSRVVEALERRLAGDTPPEVIAVLPRHCSGWLEEQVMHALRADAVRRLRKADRQDRFRIFSPVSGSTEQVPIKVHSKTLFVDDCFLTFGSANCSNRSMGLDTECNLAVEVTQRTQQKQLQGVRLRLVAEHLGCSGEELRKVLHEQGSLLAAIERLNSRERRLLPLEEEISSTSSEQLPPELARRLDPEKPVAFDTFVDEIAEESPEVQRGPGQLTLAVTVLLLAALVVFWRHSPWGSEEAAQAVAVWVDHLRSHSLAFVLLVAAYILAGLIYVPVTVLLGVTVLLYPFPLSGVYALTGCLVGALAGYSTGRMRGAGYVRKRARPGLNRLSKLLSSRTMSSLVLVRLLPLTPFGMVNVVAGASKISLLHFLGGTLLGMAPGVAALGVFAEGLKQTLLTPSWGNALLLLGASCAIAGGMLLLRRRLRPAHGDKTATSSAAR